MSEKYLEVADLDFALGRAGAALAKLVRLQSDHPDQPFRKGLSEQDGAELVKRTDTRINPEQYHRGRKVDEEAVFAVATELGFVKPEICYPFSEWEDLLGISSEDPETVDEQVEAIVVPGAAGLSNLIRLHHAAKIIRTGVVRANRIIVTAGERVTQPEERQRLLDIGMPAGETEFELILNALEKTFACTPPRNIPGNLTTEYHGRLYPVQVCQAEAFIGGNDVEITVLNVPFDRKRLLPNGCFASRANTEETFRPLTQILSAEPSTVYVVSHDIWQIVQEMIARRTLPPNKTVIGSGPRNVNRVTYNPIKGRLCLNGAPDVQDEIKKYYQELVRIHPFPSPLLL